MGDPSFIWHSRGYQDEVSFVKDDFPHLICGLLQRFSARLGLGLVVLMVKVMLRLGLRWAYL